MGEKRLLAKQFVTMDYLLKNVIPGWSERVLRRRIKEESFPFIQDSGGVMFDLHDVQRWFEERKQNVG